MNVPAWAMSRELFIAHMELHGITLSTLNHGLTYDLARHPLVFGHPLIRSSVFDNGPWSYLETGVQDPAFMHPAEWLSISNEMLEALDLSLVERLLSSTRS